MKRAALFAAFVLALIASTASAVTGPNAETVRSNCAARGITLYFWPKGHSAIPSIGFPAFATPHLEVYTSAGKQIG